MAPKKELKLWATWWIVAVTEPTLPGSIAVLIWVRVGLDQLQPCGSTAMDQPYLAPAHTNPSLVQHSLHPHSHSSYISDGQLILDKWRYLLRFWLLRLLFQKASVTQFQMQFQMQIPFVGNLQHLRLKSACIQYTEFLTFPSAALEYTVK